jgi:hypothetical protein
VGLAVHTKVTELSIVRLSFLGFDNTTITLAARELIQPATIVSWFYCGLALVINFVYSSPENQELARVKQQTVIATSRHENENAHKTVATGD